MANAMPHAIGAQTAFPGRQVISLSGDGGFTMLLGDFLSVAQLSSGLPVKVVVFNNSALGFIEIEQKSTGFLDFGTDFANPNFAAMAEACGIRGIRLEDPEDVDKGIADALAHDGPVLVDAVVSRTVLPVPPAITAEQMAVAFSALHGESRIQRLRQVTISSISARSNLWACGQGELQWNTTALLLSRIQFAFTITFRCSSFPSFTIGLAAWLTVLEALRLATGRLVYRVIFDFWLEDLRVCVRIGVSCPGL